MSKPTAEQVQADTLRRLNAEVARLQARLAEVQAESEGRRQELVRASEERSAEWIRAEQAEADRDAALAERDTYRLDIATVCHLSEDPKIVATLTRDQLLDGLREQCVVRVDEAEAELDRARQQVEELCEWWDEHREGSPNATYARIDAFVAAARLKSTEE